MGLQTHMTTMVIAIPRITTKVDTIEMRMRPFMKEPPAIWFPYALEAASNYFSNVSSLMPGSRSSLSPAAAVPAIEKRQTVPMAIQTK